MQSIEKYNRLYRETVYDKNEQYIFTERIETRSQNFNWNIKPHIHPGIYQIFNVESGSFILHVYDKEQQIESPCLLIIPPAMVHGFQFAHNTLGSIISIENTILDDIIGKYETLSSLFNNLEVLQFLSKSNEQIRISELISRIDEELQDIQPEKQGMIQSKLQELFIVLFRIWKSSRDNKTGESDSRTLHYYREFQRIIRHSDIKTNVKHIANKLGITTVHLNRICNQVADKPASRLIHEQLITKAKNYLIYTSYSISEIAYSLNFEYPNYFSRFFRKHTSLSPNEFRKQRHN